MKHSENQRTFFVCALSKRSRGLSVGLVSGPNKVKPQENLHQVIIDSKSWTLDPACLPAEISDEQQLNLTIPATTADRQHVRRFESASAQNIQQGSLATMSSTH